MVRVRSDGAKRGLGYIQIAFEIRRKNEVESKDSLCNGFLSLLLRM
jgi:hypothetical protein